MVGDLSVRKLRARFGTHPRKPGLVYVGGRWLPASMVFLGAPIFGHRRAFVSDRSGADRLWRALRISAPSLSDCLEVLEELARTEPEDADEAVLVNTYLYLDTKLANASSRARAAVPRLPLWTGTMWKRDRPVYVIPDADVARALASQLPIWQLPVSPTAVPNLIAATEASLLPDDAFDPVVHERSFVTGATLEAQFRAAVELLRDWLTRRDPKLFEARSTSWEELATARIAIDPNLQLELKAGRRAPISVPARAHVTRDPLTFYFADPDAAGEDDAGGRVIASLFTEGDRDKLALAWRRSWDEAGKGGTGVVSLAEDTGDSEAFASLFEQALGRTTIPRQHKTKKARQGDTSPAATPGSLPVRRLKRIEDFGEKAVEVVQGDKGSAKTNGRKGGLRDHLPPGEPIGDAAPAPQGAPLAYSAEEKEKFALEVLQVAINGESADLRDYRRFRGVGADALDRLRRYFEIKATYGRLPDEITLTANEAERAFRERDKFFVAVVAGLEEGYETVVKIFSNPLRTLDFKPTTSVTLAGVRQKQALEVRFPSATKQASAKSEAVTATKT